MPPITDPHAFHYQTSKRILGTLKIEKAIQDCLLYLRDYIPADFFGIHFFDPGLGIVETVVDASVEKSVLVSQTTTLTPEARDMIQQFIVALQEPECFIFERASDEEVCRQIGLDLKTPHLPGMLLDLMMDGVYLGVASIANNQGLKYTEEHAVLFKMIHDALAMSCAQLMRFRDINRLKNIISDNARQMQNDLMQNTSDEVVGAEFGLKAVMGLVDHVAPENSSVLLQGETGVGKEVIAWVVHRLSPRREGPFIKVNCGSIPPGLMESEIFGHEKGAFTGAISRRRGCFERADGGTILLDEVGELTPEAQVRLLRVLQDKEVERIGGSKPLSLDVRVIAATNRDLEAMVESGGFRRDLFFRLNVFPIIIPPLRERPFDIPALTQHFITKQSREMGLVSVPQTEPGAIDRLMDYHWPGNVRELQNIVERELIVRRGRPLTFADFRLRVDNIRKEKEAADVPELMGLDQVVIRHITRVMQKTTGKVEGPGGAAEILNVHPRTLQYRMKKLGIPHGRRAMGRY